MKQHQTLKQTHEQRKQVGISFNMMHKVENKWFKKTLLSKKLFLVLGEIWYSPHVSFGKNFDSKEAPSSWFVSWLATLLWCHKNKYLHVWIVDYFLPVCGSLAGYFLATWLWLSSITKYWKSDRRNEKSLKRFFLQTHTCDKFQRDIQEIFLSFQEGESKMYRIYRKIL